MLGVCNTGGDGIWSKRIFPVGILRISVEYVNGKSLVNSTFGELCAYFDPTKWNTTDHSLIYTDLNWMKEFRALLASMGFSEAACQAVDYSEAGMQGTDHVSMDVGKAFLRECDGLVRFTDGKAPAPIEMGYE